MYAIYCPLATLLVKAVREGVYIEISHSPNAGFVSLTYLKTLMFLSYLPFGLLYRICAEKELRK